MKNKIRSIAIIILVAIISSLLTVNYIRSKENERNKAIKVSGNIEATDVHLAFRIAGKVNELLTDEGKLVKAKDILARIDTDELSKIKSEAQASLKAAQFTYERASDDYTRLENLFQAGAISAQKRDAAKTNTDAAKANVDALTASLELANTRLGFTELSSPIDGFVLTKSAEAGEVLQAGAPVFTVANLEDIWLTAYINETDLGRVKLNQAVEIRTDTYPGRVYKGRVSFISQESEFTPKQIQTTEERVKLVYRIKVQVDNANLELKPGMPADGYILE